MGLRVGLLTFIFLMTLNSFAEKKYHSLVRRLVVFPLKMDTFLGEESEETWWSVREELTKSRRFLLASRNFMINRDVFQGRGRLSTADVVILGKLLDSHSLIVTFLENRKLTMISYECEYGQALWEQSLELHASIPLRQQIQPASLKLINDFLASFPYQGYQTVDSLIGTPLYTDKDEKMSKVYVGVRSQVQVGDLVQWIDIEILDLNPLFQGGGQITVKAEGKVVSIADEIITVRLDRVNPEKKINQWDLIKLPSESRRLQEQWALQAEKSQRASAHLVSNSLESVIDSQEGTRSFAASIAFVVNLATFLLLAF